MKIAFASIAYESLAISILSAIAKKERHTVKLIHIPTIFKDGSTREFKRLARFFSNDKEIFKQLKAYQPDLIAFSVEHLIINELCTMLNISKRFALKQKLFSAAYMYLPFLN